MYKRQDAHGLQRLDAGLDVVAVAGHPADQAGQAEGVELRPRQVGGFGKGQLCRYDGPGTEERK